MRSLTFIGLSIIVILSNISVLDKGESMALHMKSTQVQQEFGEVMDQALSGSDVIVERYGSPRVAILNYHRYEQLLESERQLLRERLQSASAAASGRATQLSESEIDQLIERARQDVYQEGSKK
jgi:hypothetical protein